MDGEEVRVTVPIMVLPRLERTFTVGHLFCMTQCGNQVVSDEEVRRFVAHGGNVMCQPCAEKYTDLLSAEPPP